MRSAICHAVNGVTVVLEENDVARVNHYDRRGIAYQHRRRLGRTPSASGAHILFVFFFLLDGSPFGPFGPLQSYGIKDKGGDIGPGSNGGRPGEAQTPART